MRLIDYALQDIERRMQEQFQRIDDAREAIRFLQAEKDAMLREHWRLQAEHEAASAPPKLSPRLVKS